jgi:predicted nucleic acid-binding protein
MVLVATSVWATHLRDGVPQLAQTLEDGLVLMHPFVLGDVMHLMERHKLYGSGLSWIDVHLLASALLSHCRLSTLDTRLDRAAATLRLRYLG